MGDRWVSEAVAWHAVKTTEMMEGPATNHAVRSVVLATQ